MHSEVGGESRRNPVPHVLLPGESESDYIDSNPRPVGLCLPVSQDGLPHAIPPPSVRRRLSQQVFQRPDDQAGSLQLEFYPSDCRCMLLQSLQHLAAHSAPAAIDPLHDADRVPHLLGLQDQVNCG